MLDVITMLNANVECCRLTGAYANFFVLAFLVVFRLAVMMSVYFCCTRARIKVNFYRVSFLFTDCLFFCLVAVMALKFVLVLMGWVIEFSMLSFMYDDFIAAVRSIE